MRIVNKDISAAGSVLPEVLRALMWLLGDEESSAHKVAVALMLQLMGREQSDAEKARAEGDKTGDKSKVPLQILKRLREKLESLNDPEAAKKRKKKKEAGGGDGEDEESARTKALCEVCSSVISPILRWTTRRGRSTSPRSTA